MNRRGFLSSILALAAAPAIVRADSLMRIVPRETLVWTPGGNAPSLRADHVIVREWMPYRAGDTPRDVRMTLEEFARRYGPDEFRRLLQMGPRA